MTARGLLIALVGLVIAVVVLRGGLMAPVMMGWTTPVSMINATAIPHGWGWGGLGLHGLSTLAMWGAVVVGLALLMRPRAHASGGDRPRDILERRYAAGEITREQYQQIRQDQQR